MEVKCHGTQHQLPPSHCAIGDRGGRFLNIVSLSEFGSYMCTCAAVHRSPSSGNTLFLSHRTAT